MNGPGTSRDRAGEAAVAHAITGTVHGFPPIAGPDARVLVLGTMPSLKSLEAAQYYAHPRNAFWPIMRELFARGAGLGYPERVASIVDSKVALWDVLASTVRPGSLDSAIERGSETPNDIAGFLAGHPGVHTVFFNGAKAGELFERHVAAGLPADRPLRYARLPSTSPANASVTYSAKVEAWREVARAIEEGSDPAG